MTVAGTSFGQVISVLGPNIGFPGTVSRFGERVITARVFLPNTSTNNLNFGDPAILLPGAANSGGDWTSVADFVATTANIGKVYSQFAGMAVREVKTQLTYPSAVVPGASPMVGYYSNGQMAEVLERGNGTVILAVGAPNAGDQVYTRVVLNGAVTAGVLGDWETSPAATDLFAKAASAGAAAGQAVIGVASTTNVQAGMVIYGQAGIPDGSYVVSLVTNTSITISNNLTRALVTGDVFTLSNLVALPGVVARTGYLDANNALEITIKNRLAA